MLACTTVKCGIKLTKEEEEEEGASMNPTYYKSIVGYLWCLICTKLDILYGVGLISSYME